MEFATNHKACGKIYFKQIWSNLTSDLNTSKHQLEELKRLGTLPFAN